MHCVRLQNKLAKAKAEVRTLTAETKNKNNQIEPIKLANQSELNKLMAKVDQAKMGLIEWLESSQKELESDNLQI